MGNILAHYCDLVLITNDDPYGEDPEKIAQGLMDGLVTNGKWQIAENYWKILDRRKAIKKAVQLAKKGDTIVILGKGSEQWQMFKDSKVPWDDRKVIREILEEISNS
jgi:UDP-N-acetylmuramoyl-L-alanyl-D-glutamate--2,6-diaminopimelate ligase